MPTWAQELAGRGCIGMITDMRTTLVLDDRLVKLAKIRAADQGVTLSEVVNQALRSALTEASAAPGAFRMLVFGDSDASSRHEPGELFDPMRRDD